MLSLHVCCIYSSSEFTSKFITKPADCRHDEDVTVEEDPRDKEEETKHLDNFFLTCTSMKIKDTQTLDKRCEMSTVIVITDFE